MIYLDIVDLASQSSSTFRYTPVVRLRSASILFIIRSYATVYKEYLGRGLAALTLSAFMIFYKREIDLKADTFFIYPDENNPRAIRVYNKAGFTKVGQYEATQGAFIGQNNDLMVKKV
jgi:RimJ/RimL family protein N-acetyltransferase